MMVLRNPTLNHLSEGNPFTFILAKGGVYRLPSKSYFDVEEILELDGTVDRAKWIERKFYSLLSALEDEGLLDGTPSRYAYIKFDLLRPLPKQLRIAKSELEGIASNQRSPRLKGRSRELWPIYLRVIDAKDQGASDMDVFNHLLNEAEVLHDLDLYERLEKVEQEAVLIHDWRESAYRLLTNAPVFL